MGEFPLPSGRVVETREPTFGDEVHVISVGLQSPEEFTYAKCAAVVPGLTREEVAKLSRRDGRALMAEVNRIFEGRPEEQEAPFGAGSTGDSRDTTSTTTSAPDSTSTGSVGV